MSSSNNTEDDEWEEEESLVLVELSGILDEDFITKGNGECKVLGIDTEQPMLQLDRYTFSGQYEDTVGTNLIFEEHPVPEKRTYLDVLDNENKVKTRLDLAYKVDKKLSMSRIFISQESAESEEGVPGTSNNPCSTISPSNNAMETGPTKNPSATEDGKDERESSVEVTQ